MNALTSIFGNCPDALEPLGTDELQLGCQGLGDEANDLLSNSTNAALISPVVSSDDVGCFLWLWLHFCTYRFVSGSSLFHFSLSGGWTISDPSKCAQRDFVQLATLHGEVDGLRDLVHRSSTCPLLSLYFFDEIGFRLTWVYFDCVSSKFLPLLESCIAMMTFVCLHFSNDLHPGRWPAENLVPSLEKFIH